MGKEKLFAYVLVKVETGRDLEIKGQVEKMRNVREVSFITGPYDIFAKVEGETPSELGEITLKIRKLKGVKKTLTMHKIA